jgi:hypothetical protein
MKMKKLLFVLPIIFITSACCDREKKIPEENLEQVIKAIYDSEWGGIKEQLLASIEIYECLTNPNCTLPEEYTDTIHYIFTSEDISHEKKIFYNWEFIENESPNITELRITTNEYAPCSFKHPNFSYDYYMRILSITIKDDFQESHYELELKLDRDGRYIDDRFNSGWVSNSECDLSVDKLNNEILPNLCFEFSTILYNHFCTNEIIPSHHEMEYSIE